MCVRNVINFLPFEMSTLSRAFQVYLELRPRPNVELFSNLGRPKLIQDRLLGTNQLNHTKKQFSEF